MIETRPNINLSDFVRTMKSYITYHYGKNMMQFYLNNFGRKELSLQMVILYVLLEM